MKPKITIDEKRRVPASHCSSCGAKLTGVSRVRDQDEPEGPQGEPGAISMCLYCGHLMAFDERLQLRELNDEEIKDIAGDPRIIEMQKARRKA
jgi:hypothetical protein